MHSYIYIYINSSKENPGKFKRRTTEKYLEVVISIFGCKIGQGEHHISSVSRLADRYIFIDFRKYHYKTCLWKIFSITLPKYLLWHLQYNILHFLYMVHSEIGNDIYRPPMFLISLLLLISTEAFILYWKLDYTSLIQSMYCKELYNNLRGDSGAA